MNCWDSNIDNHEIKLDKNKEKNSKNKKEDNKKNKDENRNKNKKHKYTSKNNNNKEPKDKKSKNNKNEKDEKYINNDEEEYNEEEEEQENNNENDYIEDSPNNPENNDSNENNYEYKENLKQEQYRASVHSSHTPQSNNFYFNNNKRNSLGISNNINLNNRNTIKQNEENNENELYGFINYRNNCYLNSSLQLLTRIDKLRKNTLNFNKNKIQKNSSITGGHLIIEFINILEQIKNKNNRIDPTNLKNIMSLIDNRYSYDNQEDANEFISNFIDALLEETSDKINNYNPNIDETEMEPIEKEAFKKFKNKFYNKIKNSFLLDLFYGILRTEKYCKRCGVQSIKFNPYNMLELPIYDLAKKNRYKRLDLKTILDEFTNESIDFYSDCYICKREIYSKTDIYKLPQYLILYFGRTVGKEYINNIIEYEYNIDFGEYLYNQESRLYELNCVIEHTGGAHYGHYTALCPIKDNDYFNDYIWYKFSDSIHSKNLTKYHGDNAIILLYKLNE